MGNPDSIGSVVYMNSYLGSHINTQGWTDMSGFSYKDARFYEFSCREFPDSFFV